MPDLSIMNKTCEHLSSVNSQVFPNFLILFNVFWKCCPTFVWSWKYNLSYQYIYFTEINVFLLDLIYTEMHLTRAINGM